MCIRDRFSALAAQIELATGTKRSPEQVAEGFIDIAVGAMANAIKKISVQRGHDVTRYALQCFGGAGGQHACGVADALEMKTVFIHPQAGVLSAFGMGAARVGWHGEMDAGQVLLADGVLAGLARPHRYVLPTAVDPQPRPSGLTGCLRHVARDI